VGLLPLSPSVSVLQAVTWVGDEYGPGRRAGPVVGDVLSLARPHFTCGAESRPESAESNTAGCVDERNQSNRGQPRGCRARSANTLRRRSEAMLQDTLCSSRYRHLHCLHFGRCTTTFGPVWGRKVVASRPKCKEENAGYKRHFGRQTGLASLSLGDVDRDQTRRPAYRCRHVGCPGLTERRWGGRAGLEPATEGL
jgi:hypothetical protein